MGYKGKCPGWSARPPGVDLFVIFSFNLKPIPLVNLHLFSLGSSNRSI